MGECKSRLAGLQGQPPGTATAEQAEGAECRAQPLAFAPALGYFVAGCTSFVEDDTMFRFFALALAALLPLPLVLARAGDKGGDDKPLKIEGQLTQDDP